MLNSKLFLKFFRKNLIKNGHSIDFILPKIFAVFDNLDNSISQGFFFTFRGVVPVSRCFLQDTLRKMSAKFLQMSAKNCPPKIFRTSCGQIRKNLSAKFFADIRNIFADKKKLRTETFILIIF